MAYMFILKLNSMKKLSLKKKTLSRLNQSKVLGGQVDEVSGGGSGCSKTGTRKGASNPFELTPCVS